MVIAACITMQEYADSIESAMTSSCQVIGMMELWSIRNSDGVASTLVYAGRSDSIIRLTPKLNQS